MQAGRRNFQRAAFSIYNIRKRAEPVCSARQPVEKRPAREISRQAAKHKRYIWAENNRKEREDSRFAFHLASFLRFMAANLSLTHLETWARPL